MTTGPNMIIECPHCGHPAKKRTYFSFNTFGGILWSDGKQTAPMKPEFPDFIFCKKCDSFFWLKDAKEICPEEDSKKFYPNIQNFEFIEYPTFMDHYRALKMMNDIKYARSLMMYSFNDLIRKNKEPEISAGIQKLHGENLFELTEILAENNENEIIMKAEAYRNLGLFGMSESLLEKITNPKLVQVKEKFLAEIRNGNRKLFILFGDPHTGR
jgi:hypothetical protein